MAEASEIDIIEEDPRWGEADLVVSCKAALDVVLGHAGLGDTPAELSILLTNDARIATLNEEFRGKGQPTNVLSWPADELGADKAGGTPRGPKVDPTGTIELGDIALAYETCVREAEEQGKPVENHVSHLVVHGFLHLLGYDHIRDADASLMEQTEVVILEKLGIEDPYSLP